MIVRWKTTLRGPIEWSDLMSARHYLQFRKWCSTTLDRFDWIELNLPKRIMEAAKAEPGSENVISQTVRKVNGTSRAPIVAQPCRKFKHIWMKFIDKSKLIWFISCSPFACPDRDNRRIFHLELRKGNRLCSHPNDRKDRWASELILNESSVTIEILIN